MKSPLLLTRFAEKITTTFSVKTMSTEQQRPTQGDLFITFGYEQITKISKVI